MDDEHEKQQEILMY